LFGLWAVHLVRGASRRTYELAEQLLQRAQSAHDPVPLLYARYALGITSYWMGQLQLAREHLESAIALYDPKPDRPLAFRYLGVDAGVTCLSYASLTLWQLGYPDQALKKGYEVLEFAQGLAHPHSLASAEYHVGVVLRHYRREPRAAQENADSVIAFCVERGFTDFLALATTMRGWAIAELGRNKEGIAEIQEGLAASRATGAKLFRPFFLCVLAQVYMDTCRLGDGLSALIEALALADEHEEREHEAEIYRLKGELLLKQNYSNASEAQSCFQRAIEIARKQSAKSLELRATTSLARLFDKQGNRDEARTILAKIYGWFTEGFDTADLKDAQALLGALNA
jgi:predicted ATPase